MQSRAFFAAACIAGVGAFFAVSTAADDRGPRRSSGYYAGLGVAIENCVTCHDVGPFGPRFFNSHGPSFEDLAQKYVLGDRHEGEEGLRQLLTAISSGRIRLDRMPTIRLDDLEIKWLAEYIAAQRKHR